MDRFDKLTPACCMISVLLHTFYALWHAKVDHLELESDTDHIEGIVLNF